MSIPKHIIEHEIIGPFYDVRESNAIFVPYTGANTDVDLGTKTLTTDQLIIEKTAVLSTREELLNLSISDSSSKLDIFNLTTNAQFAPTIQGYQKDLSSLSALYIHGVIDTTVDSGTTPAIKFTTKLLASGDKINGTFGSIVTRPLFGWYNNASLLMTMLANGNVGIGITTPTELLEVNGITKVGQIKIGTPTKTSIFGAGSFDSIAVAESTAGIKLVNTDASGVGAGAGMICYSDDSAALVTGDRLGFNLFGGSTSATAINHSVGFVAYADGDWTTTSAPAKMTFEVTPAGSVARKTSLTLSSNGDVVLGSGVAGYDQILKFDGETNDGIITWMEDEDYFLLGDDVFLSKPMYNDIYTGIAAAKVPAANYPDWTTFTTNTGAYVFKVNDYADLATIEILHDYKEGTDLEVHVHMATNGTNVDARTIKYRVYYTYGIPDSWSNVFSAELYVEAEHTIPANTPDKTSHYMSLGTISGTTMKIGTQLKFRIVRLASSGTEPTGNPFLGMVGVHYQIDTFGSRQTSIK